MIVLLFLSERMGDAEYVRLSMPSTIWHNALFGSYALDLFTLMNSVSKDRVADKGKWAERFKPVRAGTVQKSLWDAADGLQLKCSIVKSRSTKMHINSCPIQRIYPEHRELLYAGEMMPPGCLHCISSKSISSTRNLHAFGITVP